MSKTVKLFRGSMIRGVSLVLNVVIMFFIMPFIVKTLGDRMFGLWAIATSLTGYYFLFDFGISLSVQRFISQAIGKGDKKQTQAVVSNSLFIFSLLGLIALCATFIFMWAMKFFVPPDLLFVSRILILFVGMEFAFTLPLRTYEGVVKSHLDFDVFSSFETLKTILRATAIFFFLSKGYGIIALGIINFSANLFLFVINYLYTRAKYDNITFSKKLIKKETVKSLFNFSKYIFLSTLGDLFRFRMSSFIVAGYLGLASVTLYQIAARLLDNYMFLIIALTAVINPLFSRYEGAKDYQAIREKYIIGVRVSLIVTAIIGANLLIFGRNFIRLWMGPEYLDAYIVIAIITVPYIVDLSQRVGFGVLQSMEKHHIYSILNVIDGLINVGLTIFLVQAYGLTGVALGTAIPLLIIKGLIMPVIVSKVIDLSIWTYVRKVGSVALVITFFYSLIYFMFATKELSWVMMGVWIGANIVFLSLLLFLTVFSKDEKRYLSLIINSVKSRFKS